MLGQGANREGTPLHWWPEQSHVMAKTESRDKTRGKREGRRGGRPPRGPPLGRPRNGEEVGGRGSGWF